MDHKPKYKIIKYLGDIRKNLGDFVFLMTFYFWFQKHDS